jgi:4-amino-4-deoxy-L-arabinose transferase-like glycosyltransferase
VRQLPLVLLTLAAVAAFGVVVRHPGRDAEPIAWTGPAHPLLLGALFVIGATTLLVALVAAPNSWDSMTYHMARVAQWYDHGTVEHYYTAIDRQLWQPPFGGYFVLLGYGGLGGRDYLANLPQWIAGVGAVLVAMEIAGLLGASRRSRYVIALFTATAPALILQSTSTLTDLLGGFWIGCAAWLALAHYLAPRFSARDALWFGLALGLALGSKGTSIPLGIPWLALFLLPAIRPFKPRALLLQGATIALMIVVLGGSHYLRTVALYGDPFGPEAVQTMLRPASMEIPSILSNLVAHLSLQLGTPWSGVNALLSRAVGGIHSALGVDLAVLYPYFGGFRIFSWTFSEDIAGNLIHALLGLAAVIFLVAGWRRMPREQRMMAGCFLAGVLIFGATVRWQPFIARLHTPILVLLAPCLLLPLERRFPRAAMLALCAAGLLALPPLFQNTLRPIVPATSMGWTGVRPRSILVESREGQYFATRPNLLLPYRNAIHTLGSLPCTRAGLVAAYDSWEYPLWAMGRPRRLTVVHIEPGKLRPGETGPAGAAPCATVALDQPPGWRPGQPPRERGPLFSDPPISVWR